MRSAPMTPDPNTELVSRYIEATRKLIAVPNPERSAELIAIHAGYLKTYLSYARAEWHHPPKLQAPIFIPTYSLDARAEHIVIRGQAYIIYDQYLWYIFQEFNRLYLTLANQDELMELGYLLLGDR